MAELLVAYEQKFGVLPSTASQLLAFSKSNPPNRITYIESKRILETAAMSTISRMNQRNNKYKKHQRKHITNATSDDIKNADFCQHEEDQELQKRNRLRKKCVDELVSTEKTYLDGLDKLFKAYLNPLKDRDNKRTRKLLTHNDHSILFPSDLATLYALHIQLNADLIKATENWNQTTSKIGHVFIKYGELFKMYQDYFQKHEKAVQHLIKLQKRSSKVLFIYPRTFFRSYNSHRKRLFVGVL